MSESISALKRTLEEACDTLVATMLQVVMEHGDDFHDYYDYYRNEFGIDEEETEENTKVLKIIDIYNHGGCCFPQAFYGMSFFPIRTRKAGYIG